MVSAPGSPAGQSGAEAHIQHPYPRRDGRYRGGQAEVVTTGRHDPCVGIRATPIAEAMLALVLIDHALRHRGQNADVAHTVPPVPGTTAKE